ncbi:unnamed protein product [Dovyalis caffra]|uniref:Uncharacterized protein n=1 Tax=Dovyalis caffra TaxID=77055 RepID=A0AAV1ST78_9ROSI|nr:unnamed protein product [Dovyalis caffra]
MRDIFLHWNEKVEQDKRSGSEVKVLCRKVGPGKEWVRAVQVSGVKTHRIEPIAWRRKAKKHDLLRFCRKLNAKLGVKIIKPNPPMESVGNRAAPPVETYPRSTSQDKPYCQEKKE